MIKEQRLSPDVIKSTISMEKLITFYNYEIQKNHKVLCPFHQENTASFHVYNQYGKCYGGCGWEGDVIQFVMDREKVSFQEALQRLADWFGLAEIATFEQPQPKKKVEKQKDPEEPKAVKQEMVDYWYSLLDNKKRGWLREERLLTDETLDFHMVGYRPDRDAYSIPYWRGVPRHSPIDTVQHRFLPKDGRQARYVSLEDYWNPALIGRYAINPDFLCVFIGTLDAILALQDGIPAISPNGLQVWKSRLGDLQQIVGRVGTIYLVPDVTASETIESYRLARLLNAKVKYLPHDRRWKDYSDYRLFNNRNIFLEEVLQMSKSPFIEDSDHLVVVSDILDMIAQDKSSKAIELLGILEENGYAWWSVGNKLMTKASPHPYPDMNDAEWQHLIEKFEMCHSYGDLARVVHGFREERELLAGRF